MAFIIHSRLPNPFVESNLITSRGFVSAEDGSGGGRLLMRTSEYRDNHVSRLRTLINFGSLSPTREAVKKFKIRGKRGVRLGL